MVAYWDLDVAVESLYTVMRMDWLALFVVAAAGDAVGHSLCLVDNGSFPCVETCIVLGTLQPHWLKHKSVSRD